MAAAAWTLTQQFKVAVPWRVLASLGGVIVPIILGGLPDIFAQDDERTRACREHLRGFTRRRDVPVVGALRNLSMLGVTPSRNSGADEPGPYVRRDKDDEIDALLSRQSFVLIIGDSKVGKSRMAAESVRRNFADRRLIVPISADSLPALLDVGLDFRDSVIYLDELERYLEGTGLSRLLDYLGSAEAPPGATIVATIREMAYTPYIPGGELESPYWGVLSRAARVRIDRLLSPAELERTKAAFADPGMLAALSHYGLAEYLSAGPDLLERLSNGIVSRPVGAMVVLAAADWSRTGLTRPVSEHVLTDLVMSYADKLATPAPGPSDIQSALTWAQTPVYGASQLLSAAPGGFTVFDYVVDHVPQDSVPDGVWDAALAIAQGEELLQVGLAAYEQQRLDVAVRALQVAVTVTPLLDATLAAYNYAFVLEKLGRMAEAEEYYRKAADAGHAEAGCAAGRLIQDRGDLAEAQRYYQLAATAGSADAAYALGMLLHEQDPAAALPWLDLAVREGHVLAACAAGRLLEARDDQAGAKRYYETAADAGNADAAYSLGMLLREEDPAAALPWLDRAVRAGHVQAAYAASRLLEARGDARGAQRYHRVATASMELANDHAAVERRSVAALASASNPGLKSAWAVADSANLLRSQMTGYSDSELRQLTDSFRRRLQHGESIDALLPEAFAVGREAIRRVRDVNCTDAQIAAAACLHFGRIVELRRGEGRQLAALLAAYANALTGLVDIITIDESTARDQAAWATAVFQALGMESSVLSSDMTSDALDLARITPVIYAWVGDLAFDYLNGNMRWSEDERRIRTADFAIVDQADVSLISDARQPYILRSAEQDTSIWPAECSKIASAMVRDADYVIAAPQPGVELTEQGVAMLEDWVGIENLFAPANIFLMPFIDAALKAKEFFRNGKDYLVGLTGIVMLDVRTGVIMPYRRESRGVHQALEAKEGLRVSGESSAQGEIGHRAYLKLYDRLSGLTYAAGFDAGAFSKLYGLEIAKIPNDRPLRLTVRDDELYNSNTLRMSAVADLVTEQHALGRPVVVDVSSQERADQLIASLTERQISSQQVTGANASGVLADAGRKGAVTIGVDLASRPGRIALGGSDALPQDRDDVVALGGLLVIGSERRTDRRLDDLLSGIAAQHGDPGECVFMIARNDALADRLRWWPAGLSGDLAISSHLVTRSMKSFQRIVRDVDVEQLLKDLNFDTVFETYRAATYELRASVLNGTGIEDLMGGYLGEVVNGYLASYLPESKRDSWDLDGLKQALTATFGGTGQLALPGQPGAKTAGNRGYRRELVTAAHSAARRAYDARMSELGSDVFFALEQRVLLSVIDRNWRELIAELEELRYTSGVSAAIGRDPLTEYQAMADRAFTETMATVKEEAIGNVMNLVVEVTEQPALADET